MAAAESEELEAYHESIINKYKQSGVSSLTPSEVCLTFLSPSWEFDFQKACKTSWFSVVSGYKSTLSLHLKNSSAEHLKAKEQENVILRQQAGKKFLECLDMATKTKVGKLSDPTLKDDAILERLKDLLSKKNVSMINHLLKFDSNHDGMMNKSEFVTALESLSLSPQDIVALIRIAGYRPGVDLIPISGFSDFLTRRGEDRKKEEYALFTKLLNALTAQNRSLEKAFLLLDTNKDGVVTIDEFRAELSKMSAGFNFAECKEVFTVIDKDRSGSISLEELKGKLAVLLPASVKKETKKAGSLLTVNVLKGQKFKPGSRTVKVKFGTAEFTSQSLADANPEFKFKNLFEITEASPKEIEFEVFSGKKSEGKAVILTSEVTKAAELKKKLDIFASSKAVIGTLFIKATITEVESNESSATRGSLLVTLVKGDLLDLKLQVFDRIYTINASSVAKTITVSPLPRPSTQRFVLATSLEKPEHDLDLAEMIQNNGLTPVEFRFGTKKVFIQVVWEDFDEQDELEHRAAAKIQKMWRIYSVLHSTRLKSRRIMVNKKVVSYFDRRYLLVVYKVARNLEIEVHPADANVGVDTVLSLNRFPQQDLNDLIPTVSLKPDFRLASVIEKVVLRGHLYLEFSQFKGLHESLIVFNLEKSSFAVNPKEKNHVEFFNLSFKQVPKEIEVNAVTSHSKVIIGHGQLFWMHSINNKEEWTSNILVTLNNNSSFIVKARWEGLDDLSKEEEAAILIQKHWRAKKEREEMKLRLRKNSLIARKVVIQDKKMYLVSVREVNNQWVAQYNPANNPQVPLFEVEKEVTFPIMENVSELFARLG